MATKPEQQVLDWLNDAYAMEQSIVQVLQDQIDDAKSIPMMQQRIQQHLQETQQHAELVKGLIEGLGGDVSSVKSGMAGIMGRLQGMSMGAAGDQLVKDALNDYSTEAMEIASYKALIAAARQLNLPQVVQVCERILRDEEAMARFLDQGLPMVVDHALQNEAAAS